MSFGRQLASQIGVDENNPYIQAGSLARQAVFGDERADDRDQGTGGPRIYLPELRPSLKELPIEARLAAQMADAVHVAYGGLSGGPGGFDAAQRYLDASEVRGYLIDRQLSTREALVLVAESGETTTPRVKIAYRGSEINSRDVLMDVASLVGLEDATGQMARHTEQLERVQTRYGRSSIRELIGFSKGGFSAVTLGERFGVPSTTFNPGVSSRTLATAHTLEQRHTVYRTTEDLVSSTLMLRRPGSTETGGLRVQSIQSHAGYGDPISVHSLDNFTQQAPRAPGNLETATRDLHQRGVRLAELETLQAMHQGMERGQTFTEALDTFNFSDGTAQRVDVLEDGSLGTRISRGSGTVQYWEAMGGTFTESEQEHLRVTPIPQEPIYETEEERVMNEGLNQRIPARQVQELANRGTSGMQDYIDGQRADFHQRM